MRNSTRKHKNKVYILNKKKLSNMKTSKTKKYASVYGSNNVLRAPGMFFF
jgi:hypothetical protein